MDHDFNTWAGLSTKCKKCGYRRTLSAEVLGSPMPDCPAPNPVARGYNKETGEQYDIFEKPKVCTCSIKDLMSTGHNPDCPEKKK